MKSARYLLNIGSIRIYILTTGVVSNETNTYVRMYIEEFILVDLDTLELNIEVRMNVDAWKNTGLYTLATKDWLLVRNVRIALRSQLTSES